MDPGFDMVENLHVLKPAIAALPERERDIVSMRFGQEMTQAEIGERLGLSQMHISRLLTRILDLHGTALPSRATMSTAPCTAPGCVPADLPTGPR
ncbi:sigma-70 family RNA polymerase sigma factor [Embleya sp. NPDC001921]